MNKTETLNWIHSFKAKGRQADLKRMNWLLEKLDKPQTTFPAIHIVGTNGKGSTCSYLQHILTASGAIKREALLLLILLALMNVLPLTGRKFLIRT